MSHRQRSAGGIVLGTGSTIVMVRRQRAWLFPKGHVEPGETDEEAARREIREETGITELEYIGDLGEYARPQMDKDENDTDVIREIKMFLFATEQTELAPTAEIEEAVWVPYREVGERIGNVKDRAWYASVFDRVREAVQRD